MRSSSRHIMLAVVLTALAIAPLKNPSLRWAGVLLYLNVGVVLYATFLSRIGPRRAQAYWFGFAAFGWACLILHASHLPYIDINGFNNWHRDRTLFDVAGAIGRWAWTVLPHDPDVNELEYASIARFWFSISASLLGGLLSHRLWPGEGLPDANGSKSA